VRNIAFSEAATFTIQNELMKKVNEIATVRDWSVGVL
jgi:hypothetical protein